SPAAVDEQVEIFDQIQRQNGGDDLQSADRLEDRDRLWHARHNLYFAFPHLRRDARGIPTDACVPISRLAECISETEADITGSSLLAPVVGHVGDGNFHLMVLVNPDDVDEMARAKDAVDRLAERAIRMGGTCTGEHGIGQGKRSFMSLEHGTALGLM
ncbi:FAD-binding oxidoreductase, partial [Rhizobiaceae sp. 2RAB30]